MAIIHNSFAQYLNESINQRLISQRSHSRDHCPEKNLPILMQK